MDIPWFKRLVDGGKRQFERASRDIAPLALILLLLGAATYFNTVFLPRRSLAAGSLLLRSTLTIFLPRLLLLPLILWTVETAAAQPGRTLRTAALYFLAFAAFVYFSMKLEALIPMAYDHWLPTLGPKSTLFFVGFAGHILGKLPYFALLALVKHHLLMGRRAQDQERHAARLEAQLLQARLEGIRSQFQPHFLFNALNVIDAHIPAEGEVSRQMTQALSKFLRLSLEADTSQTLALGKELEAVGLYLEIQKLRFADRLKVEVEIPAELAERQVPRLILQPLVENAVKHGLERRRSVGTLRIGAREEDGSLHVFVEDDGPDKDSVPEQEAGTGLGLALVRARLLQLYGRSDLCSFGPMEGGGYRSLVKIPASPAS